MYRKYLVFLMSILMSVGFLTASEGILTDHGITATGSLAYYSAYLWRGFTLDSDPVVQPALSLSKYGITASFWGSFDYGNKDALASGETDFVIDYTKSFEALSVSIGNTNYGFPGGNTYSDELYVGVSMSKLPLGPKVIYYHDYGTGEGSYLSIDGSYGISKLTVGLHAGINNELFIAGNGGDYGVTLSMSTPLTKSVTCTPLVGYTIPFGDLEAASDGNQQSKFYGGFSLGF